MRFWFAVYAAVFGMLVVRNRFLFSTPIHEVGDTGANSIIINQAKHFELLVGNYSRQGFSHPGPGYFYVEAFGEWLFHDVLGVVPTPFNGQLLALYALNAALVATVALIVWRWTGSRFTALAGLLAAMLVISYLAPQIVNNPWMPFVYVPSFFLLLVASASVVAGKPEHLWAVALSGGLLIHGHAAFLLFAPTLAGIAVAATLLRQRGLRPAFAWPPWRAATSRAETAGEPWRRDWLIAGGVLAVFLLPILINTIANWPGEFGKYISYGSSDSAGGRSVIKAAGYVLWYWWPTYTIWVALVGAPIVAAAIYGATRIREPFVRAGLWLGLVCTGLLWFYAFAGIDHLGDPYMGYFYWAFPLFVAMSLAIQLAQRVSGRLSERAYVIPLTALVAVLALVPGFRTITNDDLPALPTALSALSQHANGRPLVIEITDGDIGPDVPGLMNGARRQGWRACVRDPRWEFIATREFICSPEETANGIVVERHKVMPGDPVRQGEITRAGNSAFVTGASATP